MRNLNAIVVSALLLSFSGAAHAGAPAAKARPGATATYYEASGAVKTVTPADVMAQTLEETRKTMDEIAATPARVSAKYDSQRAAQWAIETEQKLYGIWTDLSAQERTIPTDAGQSSDVERIAGDAAARAKAVRELDGKMALIDAARSRLVNFVLPRKRPLI